MAGARFELVPEAEMAVLQVAPPSVLRATPREVPA